MNCFVLVCCPCLSSRDLFLASPVCVCVWQGTQNTFLSCCRPINETSKRFIPASVHVTQEAQAYLSARLQCAIHVNIFSLSACLFLFFLFSMLFFSPCPPLHFHQFLCVGEQNLTAHQLMSQNIYIFLRPCVCVKRLHSSPESSLRPFSNWRDIYNAIDGGGKEGRVERERETGVVPFFCESEPRNYLRIISTISD